MSCPFNKGHGAVATARPHSFDIMSAAPSETARGHARCTQNNHFCTSTFRRDYAQISSTGGLRLYSAQPYLQVYALHFKLLFHTPLHTQIDYTPPPDGTAKRTVDKSFFGLAGRRGRPRGPMGEWNFIPGLYCKYRGVTDSKWASLAVRVCALKSLNRPPWRDGIRHVRSTCALPRSRLSRVV